MTHLSALRQRQPLALPLTFALALFSCETAVQPGFIGSGQLTPTLGTLAPFALAGDGGSPPAFLSGGGGIDLSIAPLMGFINILLVSRSCSGRRLEPLCSPCRSC